MLRLLPIVLLLTPTLLAQNPPITTLKSPLGDLLRKWYAEGTAAGNAGDFYDNRDGDHSPLDIKPWPQLKKIQYSEQDIAAKRHWAMMRTVQPFVTFGNSSTSATVEQSGSNPRRLYTYGFLPVLHQQYRRSNLYIYPEHNDYDAGHNGNGGKGGWGDLYPTNTPYLLTSQGSSGSDQPFMKAIPSTLAAFRPEVKKKLIESGLLMPTVQYLFRHSNKNVKTDEDYLSGAAHRPVFDGGNVDDLRMATLAHDITIETIPPLVQLRVLGEDVARQGREYFDPGKPERLSPMDTPEVIARIWRSSRGTRRMIVSAEGSVDLNKRPLTFQWVLLQGDAAKVRITPLNAEQTRAEIRVEWPQRRPIAPGSPMESTRVDIGVFAHNGTYYSTPSFVTFFGFDSETRKHAPDGRPLEIQYGNGNFVDLALTLPKEWRDVYVYDDGNQTLGWTRHYPDGRTETYSPEGLLVLRQDRLGRCVLGVPVRYEQAPNDRRDQLNHNPLTPVPVRTDEITLGYAPTGKAVVLGRKRKAN
jgi:hypothetical protein